MSLGLSPLSGHGLYIPVFKKTGKNTVYSFSRSLMTGTALALL